MEENTIIEEGMETATKELGNQLEDVITSVPDVVETTSEGELPVIPILIGSGIVGAIIFGATKLYKKLKKKYIVSGETKDEPVDVEAEEVDEEEEK